MSVFSRTRTGQVALQCVIYGESTNEIFHIKIASNKTVNDLRDMICNAREDVFANDNPVQLTLWRVNNPSNTLGTIALVQGAPTSVKMVPSDLVGDYITDALPITPRNIHIVIEGPQSKLTDLSFFDAQILHFSLD